MMDLKTIMAIGGYPGLFKLVSQGKNMVIVESLLDKKRMPAFSSYKISSLDDIAVFTETKDVPLKDVLKAIFDKESGKECISTKEDAAKLKDYFAEILPDYDRERVYISDIKKILSWYNLMQKNELLDFTEEPEEVNSADSEKDVVEAGVDAEKKVAKPKKAAPKSAQPKPKAASTPKSSAKPKGKTTSFSSKKGGE